MKINKKKLKKLIREETKNILNEQEIPQHTKFLNDLVNGDIKFKSISFDCRSNVFYPDYPDNIEDLGGEIIFDCGRTEFTLKERDIEKIIETEYSYRILLDIGEFNLEKY